MHKIPIKRIQLNLSQYALNLFQFSSIQSNKKYVRRSNDQISTSDTKNGNRIFTVSEFFLRIHLNIERTVLPRYTDFILKKNLRDS